MNLPSYICCLGALFRGQGTQALGARLARAAPFMHTHLDEGQHLVMHYGGGIVFGENGAHQHTFYEVLASDQHVEAVPTVFDARFQDLESQRRGDWGLLPQLRSAI